MRIRKIMFNFVEINYITMEIRSLGQLGIQATSHGVGQKRVLLANEESGCGITQIAVTDLKAGEISMAHIHPDMQEGFYVMEGNLDVTLDGVVHHCGKDDFVMVNAGVAHEMKALDDVRVMTIGCEIASKVNQLYPMLFKPNLHTLVWGTEEWNASGIESSPSVIENGCWAGMPLPTLIAMKSKEILGNRVAEKYGNELPLLTKIIDAKKDLSIQVHPDDEMAHRLHQKNGKTEMWYIIDAEPGSCIYAGFKQHLSPEQYRRMVEDGTIVEALARHEVKKGDVFFLPAGRVHAICGGIKLAEVQQSSDVTYRIYDYNRLGLDGKPRELHTELAAQAINYEVLDEYKTDYEQLENNSTHCIDSEFFSVRVIDVAETFHRNLIKFDSFIIALAVEGTCKIRIRSTKAEAIIGEGYACLIPALLADYDIIPINGKVKLLEAFIDNKDGSLLSRVSKFFHLSLQ